MAPRIREHGAVGRRFDGKLRWMFFFTCAWVRGSVREMRLLNPTVPWDLASVLQESRGLYIRWTNGEFLFGLYKRNQWPPKYADYSIEYSATKVPFYHCVKQVITNKNKLLNADGSKPNATKHVAVTLQSRRTVIYTRIFFRAGFCIAVLHQTRRLPIELMAHLF